MNEPSPIPPLPLYPPRKCMAPVSPIGPADIVLTEHRAPGGHVGQTQVVAHLHRGASIMLDLRFANDLRHAEGLMLAARAEAKRVLVGIIYDRVRKQAAEALRIAERLPATDEASMKQVGDLCALLNSLRNAGSELLAEDAQGA